MKKGKIGGIEVDEERMVVVVPGVGEIGIRDFEKMGAAEREGLRVWRRKLAMVLLRAGKVGGWARGLKIRTPMGEVEMEPDRYQEWFWENPARYRVVNKSRQVGMTEAVAVEIAGRMGVRRHSYVLFMSARQKVANDALKRVLDIVKQEGGLLGDVVEEQKDGFVLGSGARMVSLPASARAAVGHPATDVYLDEFAHMIEAEEIYENIAPCVSHGGRLTVVSTPRGQSGKFFEVWRGALRGENGFDPQEIDWSECRRYNPEGWWIEKGGKAARRKVGREGRWYKEMRPKYSEVEWARQFECDFVASVDSFFDVEGLKWMRAQVVAPVLVEGGLSVWKEAVGGRRYVIGVDCAEGGQSGDRSVAVVLDSESGEQVAGLVGRWPVSEFAHRLYDLRRRGYDGVLAIERNGPGVAVLDRMVELDPRGLYRGGDGKVGWHTNVATRPLLMSGIEEAVRGRAVRIMEPSFYEEAEVFVRDEKTGAPRAAKGEHDDVIVAAAIAWRVRSEVPQVGVMVSSYTGGPLGRLGWGGGGRDVTTGY